LKLREERRSRRKAVLQARRGNRFLDKTFGRTAIVQDIKRHGSNKD
jgi:hypothetical protein